MLVTSDEVVLFGEVGECRWTIVAAILHMLESTPEGMSE